MIRVKLDALLDFARDLDLVIQFLRKHRQETESDLAELRRVWGDETYVRHKAVIDAQNDQLRLFEGECLNMINFLERKNAAGMRVLRGF